MWKMREWHIKNRELPHKKISNLCQKKLILYKVFEQKVNFL